MLKKLRLLCAGALLCAQTTAMAYTVMFSMNEGFSIMPNKLYSISTPFFLSVDATCTLHFANATSLPLQINVTSGSGRLNNKSIKEGYQDILTVHDKQVLHIFANSSTKVELLNLGNTELSGECAVEVS